MQAKAEAEEYCIYLHISVKIAGDLDIYYISAMLQAALDMDKQFTYLKAHLLLQSHQGTLRQKREDEQERRQTSSDGNKTQPHTSNLVMMANISKPNSAITLSTETSALSTIKNKEHS